MFWMVFSQHIWMSLQLDIIWKYNTKQSYIQGSPLQIPYSHWELTMDTYSLHMVFQLYNSHASNSNFI